MYVLGTPTSVATVGCSCGKSSRESGAPSASLFCSDRVRAKLRHVSYLWSCCGSEGGYVLDPWVFQGRVGCIRYPPPPVFFGALGFLLVPPRTLLFLSLFCPALDLNKGLDHTIFASTPFLAVCACLYLGLVSQYSCSRTLFSCLVALSGLSHPITSDPVLAFHVVINTDGILKHCCAPPRMNSITD